MEESSRSSSIFYIREEEEAAEDDGRNEDGSDTDLETYSVVAVRAKVSVEVEQRKRLGTWAKRVLVLDGSTLYAYKTKGDGGSVGGWAVGGADVHVGRGSDSTRDDGRHILVISRQPAYKLTFSFNTTYEQARMIEALSSSGATVTGLDAIMLLKNLRKQQNEEQKEDEERQREIKMQRKAMKEMQEHNGSSTSLGIVTDDGQQAEEEDDDEDLTIKREKNKDEEELEEINESIYDLSTGVVSNPLYSSELDLPSSNDDDEATTEGKQLFTYSSSSSISEASPALSTHSIISNQSSDGKVNPLPKPPRVILEDQIQSTESQILLPNVDEIENDDEIDGQQKHQSSLGSDDEGDEISKVAQEEAYRSSESLQEVDSARKDACSEVITNEDGKIAGAKPSSYTNHKSSEEVEDHNQEKSVPDKDVAQGECEPIFNHVLDKESNKSDSLPENRHFSDNVILSQEEKEELKEELLDENHKYLSSKVKLERDLSMDPERSGVPPEASPQDLYLSNGLNSYLDSLSSDSLSSFNDHQSENDKDTITTENKLQAKSEEKEENRETVMGDFVSEILSDSEEKFEQLYNELNNSSQRELQTEHYRESEELGEIENTSQVGPEVTVKENGHAVEDSVDFPSKFSGEERTLKRVNSIIKKRGTSSSNTVATKRVQFNLDMNETETLQPSCSPETTLALSTDAMIKKIGVSANSTTKNPDLKSSRKKKEEPWTIPASPKVKKKALETTIGPGKLDNKKTDSKSGTLSKKMAPSSEGTSLPSSSKKKMPDSFVASQTKTLDPSSKLSPIKKKGIFTSIFFSSLPKKNDASLTKEDVRSKRKSSEVTNSSVKRQTMVDPNAPLVISGQVEVGGSINGKMSPRRVEVRDGHVMAFLLGSTTPSSRISLRALSVTPILGSLHPHVLSISRVSRCMMVLKLASKEEMMMWIHKLSDEILKVTPENQQADLTLYPSTRVQGQEKKDDEQREQEKEQVEGKEQNEGNEDNKQEDEKRQYTENKDEQELRDSMKEHREKEELPNGDLGNKISATKRQEEALGSSADVCLGDLDNTPNTRAEEDIDDVDGLQTSFSQRQLDKVSDGWNQTQSNVNDFSETLNEHRKNAKKLSEIQKKIQQFSQGDSCKEQSVKMHTWQMEKETNKKIVTIKNHHPPLRRLSAHTDVSYQNSSTDTVDNFLIVNDLPGFPSNKRRPAGQLNRSSRIISASESSLQESSVKARMDTKVTEMQRYGSETLSQTNSSDQWYHKNQITQDRILTCQSGSQTKVIEPTNQFEGRASLPSRSSKLLFSDFHFNQSRPIEIIENTSNKHLSDSNSGASYKHLINTQESKYEGNLSSSETSLPEKDGSEKIPRITWSVAATKEKFELLCSVSGENKGGRLTTKTPISRKKSSRGTVKKKRSIEGVASRRSTVRRGTRKSFIGGDLSSSQEVQGDTSDNDMEHHSQQDPLRIQPVKELKKNFEINQSSGSSPKVIHVPSAEPIEDSAVAKKSPLRKTSNVFKELYSPVSSPELNILTSRSVNVRPSGVGLVKDKEMLISSSNNSSRSSSTQARDVVICWRGPYIAQEDDSRKNWIPRGLWAAEQAVLANISNAFLAKRRLLAREVAAARIQERLSGLEEKLWDLQATMTDIDTSTSSAPGARAPIEMKDWKSKEKSLKAVEEEIAYWTSRFERMQKEAEEARQKLALALASGFAQQHSFKTPEERSRNSIRSKRHRNTQHYDDDEKDDDDGDCLDVSEA
nr:myb-like protein X isoform X2 [Procambarus clarkii]